MPRLAECTKRKVLRPSPNGVPRRVGARPTVERLVDRVMRLARRGKCAPSSSAAHRNNTSEIQPQVAKDYLRRISSRCHRNTGARMTAGTAEVHVRHRRFILAKLWNRAQRTALVREKRALTERAANGANDFARDINRRTRYPLQNFCL